MTVTTTRRISKIVISFGNNNIYGILFANCDYLAVSYPNLWDPDGIHFRKEFYPYWASCLVATMLMEGVE